MKELFLSLLTRDQAYGYELRQILERQFDGLLPTINAGQIYTTLARLERDGLVIGRDVLESSRGKRIYELTEAGRRILDEWIEAPIAGTELKDEFFLKFIIVTAMGLAGPEQILDAQRREYLQSLHDIDALLEQGGRSETADLLLEGAILHLKADLEWLDLIEQRVSR